MSEKKLFWAIFAALGIMADLTLPLLWALLATIPILLLSWWIVYRSGWL
jgi:hypothetical protein